MVEMFSEEAQIAAVVFRKVLKKIYTYGLLTKCEVKMAERTKERGQYPAILTEQA